MRDNPKVLILDDELTVHESISYALRAEEIEIVSATSVAEAVSLFSANPESYVLAFIDHRLKQGEGLVELGIGVVPLLKNLNKNITAVMISGCEDESVLKTWLDQKINRYLYKPLKLDQVRVIFEVEYEKWKTRRLLKRNQDGHTRELLSSFGLVGRSESLFKAVTIAMKASKSNSQMATLIFGESGTGKELIARGVHMNSSRANSPFLPINCASFGGSDTLLESQLFGHEKGAFTGAEKRKIGIFEEAKGGTVFLDEIHCLSIKSQEKLLRVLQERKIRRVGGNSEYPIDVRLIAACKPNLFDLAATKEFLPDLFYRLNGFDINLPALRDREDDVVVLADYFLQRKNGNSGIKNFSSEVLDVFNKHSWPGNVRELEMAVERAYEVSDGDLIEIPDLPQNISEPEYLNELEGIVPLEALKENYKNSMKKVILKALRKTNNNISYASRILKVDREDLRYKIKALKLNSLTNEEKLKLIEA